MELGRFVVVSDVKATSGTKTLVAINKTVSILARPCVD